MNICAVILLLLCNYSVFSLSAEQWSTATGVRSHCRHHAWGCKWWNSSFYWARTRNCSWRGADWYQSDPGQCNWQRWHLPKQPGEITLLFEFLWYVLNLHIYNAKAVCCLCNSFTIQRKHRQPVFILWQICNPVGQGCPSETAEGRHWMLGNYLCSTFWEYSTVVVMYSVDVSGAFTLRWSVEIELFTKLYNQDCDYILPL